MASRFDVVRPNTVDEACSILRNARGVARVHAGGTDLIVQARTDRFYADLLVDLGGIADLRYIRTLDDGTLRIGAGATLTEVAEYLGTTGTYHALREAILLIGSIQIRNRATLAGNICNASPAADTVPPLVIFDGRVNVVGPEGNRSESVIDFITGPGRTTLREGELVASVDIPALPAQAGSSYLRITRRRAVDLATVDVAALVTDGGEVRFSYGAVSPRPMPGVAAAKLLEGNEVDDDLLNEASRAAMAEVDPIADVRSSREYRVAMVGVLTARTYRIAQERLAKGSNR